jgi:hypothetical protein
MKLMKNLDLHTIMNYIKFEHHFIQKKIEHRAIKVACVHTCD